MVYVFFHLSNVSQTLTVEAHIQKYKCYVDHYWFSGDCITFVITNWPACVDVGCIININFCTLMHWNCNETLWIWAFIYPCACYYNWLEQTKYIFIMKDKRKYVWRKKYSLKGQLNCIEVQHFSYGNRIPFHSYWTFCF